MSGATGAVLDRSLVQLRNLIDGSLAEVRVTAGMPARSELLSMSEFVADIRVSAALEAETRECRFIVSFVAPDLAVSTDRDLLHSAVGNVLQNAFRCTAHRSEVSLKVYRAGDRVMIDVEDHCGGLSPGAAEKMFQPFTQGDTESTGMGLGLSICRRSVEAIDGVVNVRNVPGSGCVFTI